MLTKHVHPAGIGLETFFKSPCVGFSRSNFKKEKKKGAPS